MASKQERLAVYFGRLAAAPAAGSFAEAYTLVCDTMNAVEDLMTDEPYDPARWAEQDRMYPPQMDRSSPVEGRPGVTRFQTRGNAVFISEDGDIEIQTLKGKTVFTKPGKGRGP